MRTYKDHVGPSRGSTTYFELEDAFAGTRILHELEEFSNFPCSFDRLVGGAIDRYDAEGSIVLDEGIRRILLVKDRQTNESWRFGFAEFATVEVNSHDSSRRHD